MDVDDYLWGGGYFERNRAYYPPPLEPVQFRVECFACGETVAPEDHVAFDGVAFHNRCLPEEARE